MNTEMNTNNIKNSNEELRFLTTEEVAKALDCSLPTARKIMGRRDFPLIRVGKNMKVSQQAFLKWAESRRI